MIPYPRLTPDSYSLQVNCNVKPETISMIFFFYSVILKPIGPVALCFVVVVVVVVVVLKILFIYS